MSKGALSAITGFPALVFCLLALMATPAWTQSARGRIEGMVADESGARVPGARVEIVQIETAVATNLSTNEQGVFQALSLSFGTYRVTVQADGFRTVVREPVYVRAETLVRLDVVVQPGVLAESVTVTDEAPIIDSSTTNTPTSMASDVIEELPIISMGSKRNVTQLLANVPGLTSYDANDRESATWRPGMNGAARGNTETFVEGGPTAQFGIARGATEEVGPTVETVGEFSVVANSFNAEYGGFGSWFTVVSIKSGQNEVHGSVYNHHSNSALLARSFFQPKKTPGAQNEGGFTIGGPVVIPKLYNGRNRTFFFGALGLYYTRNGASGELRTVPTAEFKQGDFSQLMRQGQMVPIFDPLSTSADGSGGFTRTPFSGNRIPTERISEPARQIAAFMPDPDIAGAQINNFYSRSFAGTAWPYFNSYQTTLKLDHNFTEKQRLSVTYLNQIRHRQIQGQGTGWTDRIEWGSAQENPLDFTMFQIANSWAARANYDYIISPSVVNHLNISTDRYINLGANGTNDGDWVQRLGLTGIPEDTAGAFPGISFSGGAVTPMNIGRSYDQILYETRYAIDQNISWVKGNHNFKFGFNHIRAAINNNPRGGVSGTFSFSNSMTSLPNSSNYGIWGDPFASFLLGATNTADALIGDMTGQRYRRYALFAQDEWRVTQKLTLSYGMRWDYNSPMYEVNDKYSSFKPELSNPNAGGLPGALAFTNTYSQNFQDTWARGFAPRLGLAFQLDQKTVLRASAGIYYAASGNQSASSAGYTLNATFDSPDGFTPVYYWGSESFPQDFRRPPVEDPSFLNGQNVEYVPSNGSRLPQINSWNFGIQREVARDLALDVAYIGSQSSHLFLGSGTRTAAHSHVNVTDISYLSLGNLLFQPINSPAAIAAGFTEPFPGFANQKGANTVAQALKPYPQFRYIHSTAAQRPEGTSNMHSLQIRATKRYSQGLTFLTYFTWMKSMSLGAPQYPLDRGGDMAVDAAAAPAVFGLTWTYELPFGTGRRYAMASTPVLRTLASGWSFNGFLRYQSGNALTMAGPSTLAALGYTQRASYVGGDPLGVTNPREFDPGSDRYVNRSAFVAPGTFELGNTAPTLDWVRGFTSKSESFQVMKRTYITESTRLELGADFTNPFNFHRWGNPNTTVTSANFGLVTTAAPGRQVQISASLKF